MSSQAKSTQLTNKKKINFARLSRIVVDLFAMILRDVLLSFYPRQDDLRKQLLKDTGMEQKFRENIEKIFKGDGYEFCDVSLLHKLIRHTCPIDPPTDTHRRKGWGRDRIPSQECTTLGDEMERIRIIRNRICGHIHSTEIEDNMYEKYKNISLSMCQRLASKFGTKDYVEELRTIDSCRMEDIPLATVQELTDIFARNQDVCERMLNETRKCNEKMDALLLKHQQETPNWEPMDKKSMFATQSSIRESDRSQFSYKKTTTQKTSNIPFRSGLIKAKPKQKEISRKKSSDVLLSDSCTTFQNVKREELRFSEATGASTSLDATSQSLSDFLQNVHFFQREAEKFVLVVGKTNIIPNIESLALIPWLCVFDFDMFSRKDGLMSVLEGHMKTVHPCTWRDRPHFCSSYTYWCQLRGNIQIPVTCINGDVKTWAQLVKSSIKDHLDALSQYVSYNGTLKILFLWPERNEEMDFINRLLMKIEEEIIHSEIYAIHPSMQKGSLIISPSVELEVPYESFYLYLKNKLKTMPHPATLWHCLPTYDKSNNPLIDVNTNSHLQKELSILYINRVKESRYDVEDIQEEGENFLRGGTLAWFAYYEVKDYFDVKRDQMNTIVGDIRQMYIDRSISGIIEIYHSPGSGGTTLAKRILWELHEDVPCVEVKPNSHLTIADVVEHMKLIFEKTQLPVLILLDGRNNAEVRHFYRKLKLESIYFVILHVQRRTNEMNAENLQRGEYWINPHVTEREAKQLCIRYIRYCDNEQKSETLKELSKDVREGGLHQVYEFGITTFAHEYVGIHSIVRGYLQLQQDRELDSSQKLLGYLSLIYFYGQMSVPCAVFSKLLNKERTMTFDDLPNAVRRLVINARGYQHSGYVRICHYVVAKEVLEQILTRNVTRMEEQLGESLSEEACRNLEDFGLDFIRQLTFEKEKTIPWSRNIIADILTKIFISRNTENDGEVKIMRRKFSRFFSDIERHTKKRDRIRIMEKLVSCFPENPNYHAHLGRMYTLYFTREEEETAEECFKMAIDLCEKENKAAKQDFRFTFEEEITSPSVYHMYGMHFYQRICWITRDPNQAEEYHQAVHTVLNYAQNSCSHFETARENAFPGEGELYGLTGEIMVRTEVCSYIKKHINMPLSEFVKTSGSPVVRFVTESMLQLCELITRCYSTVDKDEIPFSMTNYTKFIKLYKDLFRGNESDLQCKGPLDLIGRRHRVIQIKLKYDEFDILSLNNKISAAEVRDVIQALQENFRDLNIKKTINLNKGLFESDFRDWVNAIRLDQYDVETPLEDVLKRIHQWHDLRNTPSSKYYIFVICAALALITRDRKWYIEAKDMFDEVKRYKNHFKKPYKLRELLGEGPGIKCLIPGAYVKTKGNSSFNDVEIDTGYHGIPKILKGTISGSNKKPQSGMISFEVCTGTQIDAYFVPARTREKLIGSRYSNQRVEFILGFTISHGMVAYNVKTLKQVSCKSCPRKVEFCSNQNIAHCSCGAEVQNINNTPEDTFDPSYW